ncbi:hypothetical protein NHQ30_000983 [Ciborinia camelliae]|nr:hypothetical protein NHQ30_000983 [Ciborinia camelliae]
MYAITITCFAAAIMGIVVTAQTSSVANLFVDGFDNNNAPFVGSIIAADASATTYSITCASLPASTITASSFSDVDYDCAIPDSFIFTQGPSTFGYIYSYDNGDPNMIDISSYTQSTDSYLVAFTVGCVLSGSSSACCSVSGGFAPDYSSAQTKTYIGTEVASYLSLMPVTITAGFSNLSAAATKTASYASATDSNKSSTTNSDKSSATGSSASGTSTSIAGMAMITAKAQWVVGGAAAAMVMAAL